MWLENTCQTGIEDIQAIGFIKYEEEGRLIHITWGQLNSFEPDGIKKAGRCLPAFFGYVHVAF